MANITGLPQLRWGSLLVLGGVLATAASASTPKEPRSPLEQKAFFRPELYISSSHVPLKDALVDLPGRAAWESFLLTRGERPESPRTQVFIDPRSGGASSLVASFPLIPGDGVGNRVALSDVRRRLGTPVRTVGPDVVAQAVRRFVSAHQALLAVDVRELGPPRATRVNEDLWQVSIPRVYRGVPVRESRLAASISHGNLVVIGTEAWGPIRLDAVPRVAGPAALAAGFDFADGRSSDDLLLREPRLEIVPFAPPEHQHGDAFAGPLGTGYGHRLVWTFVFQRPPDENRWEVMVDAHDGEVIAFVDLNQYEERPITGGVYPLTSTGICPSPGQCGTMQAGWPMPFADTGLAAPANFTNGAGIFDYAGGTTKTTLAGKYVKIGDSCGAVNESSTTGALDLGGANGDHDCTSAGASAGDTPAARSAFYEVNKLVEMARGWLPGNTWLQAQLTAKVNLNNTCNAFWDGSTINFYRSGGGCRNTGEIAGVFDHEWGHGLDQNDTGGSLSNPSEAYADIAAIYRLHTSCLGHGFFWTYDNGCGQTADGTGMNADEAQVGAAHCDLDCSGVRDADWAKHADQTPDTPLGFVCSSCASGFPSPGACGKQVHCSAAPSRQAAWDLVARDLQAAPYNYDSQTAFIVGNSIFYAGSGNIGSWHACTCGSSSSGCGSTNAYMQWLTADDDNGNLADGTPHMTAIYNAFNRHGIACSTPTPVDSGCAAGPAAAPSLTATPGNFSVALSWGAVSGATRYWVFRTEGHAGCDFGKTRIAEVTGTSYTDDEVANGRPYHYNVVAAGSSSACYGRASSCVSATPTPTTAPDFALSCSPSSVSVAQGSSGTATCTVSSQNGFNAAVDLSCTGLPAGAACSLVPNPATPPAGGSVGSTLTVSVAASTATGTHSFQVRGARGTLAHTFAMSLQVTPAATPDFSLSCSPSSLSVAQGGSGAATCTVSSLAGFAAAVDLSCTGLPAGAACAFVPDPVSPPAGGSANSTLTVSVDATTAVGTYAFQAQGASGSISHAFSMSLQVTGGGVETAVFDPALQAPTCAAVGSGCDSGASLLLGRDSRGPEPNQPNTVNDSCADGGAGTFHSDESNDRLLVVTTDGTALAAGKTVRVTATVWAWTSPSADHLDLYSAADARNPSWRLIGTLTPTRAGAQTLSATYTLPAGTLQAVRARFRYLGTASPCTTGAYDDHDDLVFAVESVPQTDVFFDDFETDLGWTRNPAGSDTATTGLWERGDPEPTTYLGAKQLGTTASGLNDLSTGRLAGSSVGDNDIDGGVTSILSPPVALPSTGGLALAFRYYLAHASNSSTADFFRVKVVGTTTATVFETLGATADVDAAWTSASVGLDAFAGQTVRLLVEAADAGTASLVEAGLDDVRITQQ